MNKVQVTLIPNRDAEVENIKKVFESRGIEVIIKENENHFELTKQPIKTKHRKSKRKVEIAYAEDIFE